MRKVTSTPTHRPTALRLRSTLVTARKAEQDSSRNTFSMEHSMREACCHPAITICLLQSYMLRSCINRPSVSKSRRLDNLHRSTHTSLYPKNYVVVLCELSSVLLFIHYSKLNQRPHITLVLWTSIYCPENTEQFIYRRPLHEKH